MGDRCTRRPRRGVNGVAIHDVYDYVMVNHAKIYQAEVDNNLNKLNEPIDSSQTLAVYIRKQELCHDMAEDAHIPITEATMVATGTKHVVATGGMDDAWHVWKRLPNDQQTWVQWESMWSGAFIEKWELLRLTDIAYNSMANEAQEIEMGNTMVVAIDNLAKSAVQKNDNIERLVISNASLPDSLTARTTKIARILTVITNLSTGGGSIG